MNYLRFAVCGLLTTHLCFALPSFARNPQDPATQPSAPSGAQSAPKKVWTNENIGTARGAVSVIGGTSDSARSRRQPSSMSNGATFINPKEGELVRPGDTIHIDLTVDSDVTPAKGLAIISPMGLSKEIREGPPYSFTFKIPESDLRGASNRLIGLQDLTLFGTVIGRKDYGLAATTVDVEEPEFPVSLEVIGPVVTKYIPYPLKFFETGVDERIDIYARFPNGREHDVTDSTYLSLTSENPNVARVGDEGTITSVGPGQTHIIITYTLGDKQKQIALPVAVAGSQPSGLDVSPATLDFGNVPSGVSSAPLRVTLTNQTRADVHLFKLEPRGGFAVGPENCSEATLAPGDSCAITVTFAPIRPGPVHATIFVPNSHTMLSIALFGNGT
jgi:hypothetical protein